jgi:hypothetical protein
LPEGGFGINGTEGEELNMPERTEQQGTTERMGAPPIAMHVEKDQAELWGFGGTKVRATGTIPVCR